MNFVLWSFLVLLPYLRVPKALALRRVRSTSQTHTHGYYEKHRSRDNATVIWTCVSDLGISKKSILHLDFSILILDEVLYTEGFSYFGKLSIFKS